MHNDRRPEKQQKNDNESEKELVLLLSLDRTENRPRMESSNLPKIYEKLPKMSMNHIQNRPNLEPKWTEFVQI